MLNYRTNNKSNIFLSESLEYKNRKSIQCQNDQLPIRIQKNKFLAEFKSSKNKLIQYGQNIIDIQNNIA